jgi:hypothetical protein
MANKKRNTDETDDLLTQSLKAADISRERWEFDNSLLAFLNGDGSIDDVPFGSLNPFGELTENFASRNSSFMQSEIDKGITYLDEEFTA